MSAASAAPLDQARFTRTDAVAGAVVFVIAMGVYIATLAPSVTLEDSGELITGAAMFGVPHPPGYPMWSLSGFLLANLLPIGSYAWRVNLLSAVFGAAASGVLAVVVAASGRWMLERLSPDRAAWYRPIGFGAGLAAGLILAFSDVMWSQAVIAEVYTLNALFLTLTLLCWFRWMARPEGEGWLLAGVFVFSLGLTNHHTLLLLLPAFVLAVLVARAPELLNRTMLLTAAVSAVAALAGGNVLLGAVPLVLVGLWQARGTFFPSFLVGMAALVASALAVLAWMSEEAPLRLIAVRAGFDAVLFVLAVAFAFVRVFSWRRMLVGFLSVGLVVLLFSLWLGDWFTMNSALTLWMFLFTALAGALVATSRLNVRLIAAMLALGWLGLLPYAYMPLASSTTPPMDWGYAQEGRGFFLAVNRGQYPNNLSATIESLAAKAGLYQPPDAEAKPILQRVQTVKNIGMAVRHYWLSLEENFTVPIVLLAFAVIFVGGRLGSQRRAWLYFLIVGFALLAFMMTLIEPPEAMDNITAWATRVFTLQSHCIFVLFIGYGLVVAADGISRRLPQLPRAAPAAMVFLSLLPLHENFADANQHGHWFGYQYGRDMVGPLAPNAVLFGGTDPGRFVPTYMIFGESTRPDAHDPHFDRRDVFIITQNSLADPYYLKYLTDQYDRDRRTRDWSAFERWLGRPEQYPPTDIVMPSNEDMREIYRKFYELAGDDPTEGIAGLNRVFTLNGLVSEWIFQHNKDTHPFYLEESLEMPWTYQYAVPDGLILRLEPEKVTELPAEAVARDRAFWDAYTARLLATPGYLQDPPAQRAFGKLRLSIGNVYRYHGMQEEALHAYRQASALSPDNIETTFKLAEHLRRMGRLEESDQVLARARDLDPANQLLPRMLAANAALREQTRSEERLAARAAKEPGNLELHLDWLAVLNATGNHDKFDEVLKHVVQMPDLPHEEFIASLGILQRAGRVEQVTELLELREKVDSSEPELHYNLAALYAFQGRTNQALTELRQAEAIAGQAVRDLAAKDGRFYPIREDKAFISLIGQPWKGLEHNRPPAYMPFRAPATNSAKPTL